MAKTNSTYGDGPITLENGKWRVRILVSKGKYKTIGYYADHETAVQMRDAALISRGKVVGGVTLRRWGESWLFAQQKKRSIKSITTAWNVVVHNAPFIDTAVADLIAPDLCRWFWKELPLVQKQRSVLENGKRRRATLPEPISHTFALSILANAKRCFEAAKREGLFSENPIATVSLDSPILDDGEAPLDEGNLDYRTAEEIDLILGCQLCAEERGIVASDILALRDCPHMPFEQRVVFTLQIHQAPRQGELAGMDWERCSWSKRGWTIAKSWNRNRTKSGKVRWQAWIPRAERALRAWWELKGCPKTGIVFPSSKGPRRKTPLGKRAAFVLSCPEGMAASDVVERARQKGIALKAQTVHAYRSKARQRADASKPENQVRYAEGYDWGWADHKEKDMTRLGWPRRCGVPNPGRFHENRDTAATHLLSGTWGPAWSLKDVSDFLGHTDVKVTEQRYAHVTKEARQKRAQSLESDPFFAAKPAENLPKPCEVESRKSLKSLAPEPGLEPGTRRLTAVKPSNEFNGLEPFRQVFGRFDSKTSQIARSTLSEIAAAGSPNLLLLASAVLAERHVVLAFEILKGGPYAQDRAIELAHLIVPDAARSGDALPPLFAPPVSG